MKEAIKSDRTTIYNAIKDAGQEQLAEHIETIMVYHRQCITSLKKNY